MARAKSQNGPRRTCPQHPTDMRWMILCLFTVVLALQLAGCTTQKPTPDEIRQRTAQTTEEIRKDTAAIAEGVREGLHSDKPVDLNTAGRSQLAALPGFTNERADKVIAGRPYSSTDQLVSRHIVSRSEYDRIASQITVNK